MGEGEWRSASVPGCVHTDLFAAGLIPDPLSGSNEKELQWIGKKRWEYRTVFSLDSLFGGRDRASSCLPAGTGLELVFEGLDTFAEVYLNDSLVLKADNMFREWRLDCSRLVRRGENTLRVVFSSAYKRSRILSDRFEYRLPGKERVFARKAQYQFGWDWAPRHLTAGIWRPVRIEYWRLARIDNVRIIQEKISKDRAVVLAEVSLEVASKADFKVWVVDKDAGRVLALSGGRYEAGELTVPLEFKIENPRLWWPNGLGEPFLYELFFAVSSGGEVLDVRKERTGLRTVELITEPDSTGSAFFFRLNGMPVFMKGANYVPADIFPSEVKDKDYRRLVGLAEEAGMNMIRVWGGGVYEKDVFYDLCDEEGILIWQDFMFACGMYPFDSDFLENVKLETEGQVRRLRNHPCIALWCGNNEVEEGWRNWGWVRESGYSPGDSARIWNGYEALFHRMLPGVVRRLDGTRSYVPSSPRFGRGERRSLNEGDLHYWGVWHDKEPFSALKDKTGRFMSEFGFQSYPDIASIAVFCDTAGIRGGSGDGFSKDGPGSPAQSGRNGPLFLSPCLESHQKHPAGNRIIMDYMERNYPLPESFGHFVYLSQLLQAEGIAAGIEAQRRAKPFCMGSLYWQLNDCWPAVSWSSIDYFGRRKALHYFAKRAFGNLLVSLVEEDGVVKVYIVSDQRDDLRLTLRARFVDFSGRILWRKNIPVDIPASSSSSYFSVEHRTLLNRADEREYLLYCELARGPDIISRNSLYFVAPVDLILPRPRVKVAARRLREGYRIELYSRELAKNIYLRLEGQRAEEYFSDNYFDLLPSERAVVKFYTSRKIEDLTGKLRLTSLADLY